MLLNCCCDVLVYCHTRGETEQGTGDVSRLDPKDGRVLWTYDCGVVHNVPATDANVYDVRRVPTKVVVGADRGIYVLWQFPIYVSGSSGPIVVGAPGYGVLKLSVDGKLLGEVSFGPRSIDYGPDYDFSGWIRTDPSSSDRIWVGAEPGGAEPVGDPDEGKFLHCIDQALNVLHAYGAHDLGYPYDSFSSAGIDALAVDSTGDVWLNLGSAQIYKLHRDGTCLWSNDSGLPTYVWTGSTAWGINLRGFAVDGLDKLLAAGYQSLHLFAHDGRWISRMNGTLPTDWSWHKELADFDPGLAGDWLDSVAELAEGEGSEEWLRCAVYDPATGLVICGANPAAEWIDDLGHDDVPDTITARFSLFAIETGGPFVQYCQSWPEPDGAPKPGSGTNQAQGNAVNDIALWPLTGCFLAGVATTSASPTYRQAAKIDPGTGLTAWSKQIVTGPDDDTRANAFARGVAVRSFKNE